MTSPFEAPISCSTPWVNEGGTVSIGCSCSNGIVTDDPNCLPTTNAIVTACPLSWRAVTTSNFITTCCPEQYGFRTDQESRCYSSAGGTELTAFSCATSGLPTKTVMEYGFLPGVWAQAVSYVGTSTPTPSAISSSMSSSALASNTAHSSSSPTSTTTTISSPQSSSKLSKGAIAGLVIGTIAAIAIVLAAIFLVRKRNQRLKETSHGLTGILQPSEYYDAKPELELTSRAGFDAANKAPVRESSPPKVDPIELAAHGNTSRANQN